MVKSLQGGGQNLPADVTQVIDQLERHCLAPDGSLVSKPAHYDLQLAREEMSRERLRYLEAMAIYCEAIAMVEEYQQAVSMANLGGVRDVQALYPQLGLKNSPQVYETLEHRMVVAEASQRLRLPLISKDGEIHEEEIEKLSRSSLDSTSTSVTISSSTNSTNYASASSTGSIVNNSLSVSSTDTAEPGVGGVPNRFLGITPAFLWQTQLHQTPSTDMAEYQMALSREIDSRLKTKCDKVADAFIMDDIESSSGHHSSSARLPESNLFSNKTSINRVKLIIEEIEREEAALRQELYSADRKFAEYYNVLEQILGVLIKLVKDLKLQHQHKYDDLQKTWLCKRCETMNAKLRKYLVEATEEASISYNKAVTRLREYQGVDPHFDNIARQYHDIVMKLENMQWTIHQVEMDLKRLPDQSSDAECISNKSTVFYECVSKIRFSSSERKVQQFHKILGVELEQIRFSIFFDLMSSIAFKPQFVF
uniref:AUGMIN subunit 4 n=1 Tax=Cucumis melo TaxID=3656 RepID=A0A9I9D4K4_CUCME